MAAVDNLELAEALADALSTGGNMMAFAGPVVGGSLILSAISILVGIGAIVTAQDVQRRIDEERFNRNKPTPGPTTTVATTAAAAAASGKMAQIITSTI